MTQKQSDRISALEKFQYEFSATMTEKITNISTSLSDIKNLFSDFIKEVKQNYVTKEEMQAFRREMLKDFSSGKRLYAITFFLIGAIVSPLIVIIISKSIN